MSTVARLGAFGAVLATAFGLAWGVGAAVDPIATPDAPAGDHVDDGHGDPSTGPSVTGLTVAADGYRLVTDTVELSVGEPARLAFRIVDDTGDDAGATVTDFDETHERDLHLILVRQDLTGFQHVHPAMAEGGTWSIDLAVEAPGPYRLYAEFQPTGEDDSTVLSTTAFATGDAPLTPIGGESLVSTVDGYELALTGELVAGTTSDVTVEVRHHGEPVTDLEPYLGAAGHLVALRAGDLAYAHVHPVGEIQSGPLVPFAVEVPSPGTYRLFLDFQHDGVVRTASFTVVVPGAGEQPATHVPATHPEDDHG